MAVVASLIGFATPASSQAETIFALVGNTAGAQQLSVFDSAAPGTATSIGPITGVQPGERIVGIDANPQAVEVLPAPFAPDTTRPTRSPSDAGDGPTRAGSSHGAHGHCRL